MVQSTISYNVNGENPPRPDVLEKHIRAINPRWLLIMNNPGTVQAYARKFPGTKMVARNQGLTKGDENTYTALSPSAWLDARLPEAGDGIYLHTGNEAGIAAKWHVDLMKLILQRKLTQVRLVISNVAVGTPPDVTEWTKPEMREFFQLLDEHRDQFVLGLHEYFCGIAPSGFVGGYPDGSWKDGRTNLHPNYEDRHLWPADATLLGMLWHCGRLKVVNDAARSFGFNPPRILITEHGADDLSDMADWAKRFPLPDGYTKHRGWKTLSAMWAKLLPGRSAQQAFFENVNYLKSAIYAHYPNVEGQLLFSWTSNPAQNQFDLSQADEFMALLETAVGNEQPAPALPAFPTDFDARAKSYMVRATDGATTVRQSPNRLSPLMTTIPPTPSIINLIDAGDLLPGERVQETIDNHLGVWLPVMVGPLKGWSFNGYLDVQPVIVSQPPTDPPAPALVKWQVVIDYEGTPEQRANSKVAWAGMDTFMRRQLVANVQPVRAIQVVDKS